MGYVGLWAIKGQFREFCGRQNLWAMLKEYGLRGICVMKASSVYSKYRVMIQIGCKQTWGIITSVHRPGTSQLFPTVLLASPSVVNWGLAV